MVITVFGAGYVGLVTATFLSVRGHRVQVFDPDERKVAAISQGRVPFREPQLDEGVTNGVRDGRLIATLSATDAMRESDVVMVCAGTPLTGEGDSDISQVIEACGLIAQHRALVPVVVRSTLPLGASESLAAWLQRRDWETVATNPEFLRQGTAVSDIQHPDRIVIGTRDGAPNPAAGVVLDLFDEVEAPRVVTDFATAELIKNVSNAFLAARLSLVNEVADLCEVFGANVDDVTKAVGMDPRIGAAYLRPGIGFGGSCLPKELTNLVRLAEQRGMSLRAIEAAGRSNDLRPTRIADRLENELGTLANLTVAVLGLAFKAGTDDTRNSPAIALANALIAKGASVVAHDPWVPESAEPDTWLFRRAPSPEEAMIGTDLTVIATEWPEYAELDWSALALAVGSPIVFDGRRILDVDRVTEAGWRVIRVGERSTGTAPGLS